MESNELSTRSRASLSECKRPVATPAKSTDRLSTHSGRRMPPPHGGDLAESLFEWVRQERARDAVIAAEREKEEIRCSHCDAPRHARVRRCAHCGKLSEEFCCPECESPTSDDSWHLVSNRSVADDGRASCKSCGACVRLMDAQCPSCGILFSSYWSAPCKKCGAVLTKKDWLSSGCDVVRFVCAECGSDASDDLGSFDVCRQCGSLIPPTRAAYGFVDQQAEEIRRRVEWFSGVRTLARRFFALLFVVLITVLIFSVQSPENAALRVGLFGVLAVLATSVLVWILRSQFGWRVFDISDSEKEILRRSDEYSRALADYDRRKREREEAEQRRKADFWWRLGGHDFEWEMLKLFQRSGVACRLTPGSGDDGVDIVLEKDEERVAVQCKAHRNPVGPAILRELLGAMHAGGFNRAILVALGGVTSGAGQFARQNGIEIMTMEDVLNLNDAHPPP